MKLVFCKGSLLTVGRKIASPHEHASCEVSENESLHRNVHARRHEISTVVHAFLLYPLPLAQD